MTIYEEIQKERQNQDERWGEQNHSHLKWNAILSEETGECSEIVNELYPAIGECFDFNRFQEDLRQELIKTAAVCVAWLESIERNKK